MFEQIISMVQSFFSGRLVCLPVFPLHCLPTLTFAASIRATISNMVAVAGKEPFLVTPEHSAVPAYGSSCPIFLFFIPEHPCL